MTERDERKAAQVGDDAGAHVIMKSSWYVEQSDDKDRETNVHERISGGSRPTKRGQDSTLVSTL